MHLRSDSTLSTNYLKDQFTGSRPSHVELQSNFGSSEGLCKNLSQCEFYVIAVNLSD